MASTKFSGLWSLVSGIWNQGIRFRRLLCCLSLVCVLGCEGLSTAASTAKLRSSNAKSLSEIRYDGGFVFADRDHVVGIDVSDWALTSVSQVRTIQSSCECVQASLKELEQGSKKIHLVVEVAADMKISRNASLAVMIEAVLTDESKRSLTFEFTHVAQSTTDKKD